MGRRRKVRYGEFPTLFEGMPPEDEVDLEDPRTASKLVGSGDWDVYRLLFPDPPDKEEKERRRKEESWELAERLLGKRELTTRLRVLRGAAGGGDRP